MRCRSCERDRSATSPTRRSEIRARVEKALGDPRADRLAHLLAHDADRMLLLLEALLLLDHPESPLSEGDHAGAVRFLLQLLPRVRALLGPEGPSHEPGP